MLRILFPAFAILIAIGDLHACCAGDLALIRARKLAQKAKLEKDVRDAVARSSKFDRRDARFLLESLLREVKDSHSLTPEERQVLVEQLQARMREIQLPSASAHGAVGWLSYVLPETKPARTPIQFPERFPSSKPIPGRPVPAPPKKLLKTLGSTLSVEYEAVKLKDVVRDLQKRTDLILEFDALSEIESKIDRDKPVTLKLEKAEVRTILRKILAEQQRVYVIKDAKALVVTPKRVAEHLYDSAYPVGDLTHLSLEDQRYYQHPFAPPPPHAVKIIKFIQEKIEPDHWSPKGPGTMLFYPPTQTLHIRASAEVHYQLSHPSLFSRTASLERLKIFD